MDYIREVILTREEILFSNGVRFYSVMHEDIYLTEIYMFYKMNNYLKFVLPIPISMLKISIAQVYKNNSNIIYILYLI